MCCAERQEIGHRPHLFFGSPSSITMQTHNLSPNGQSAPELNPLPEVAGAAVYMTEHNLNEAEELHPSSPQGCACSRVRQEEVSEGHDRSAPPGPVLPTLGLGVVVSELTQMAATFDQSLKNGSSSAVGHRRSLVGKLAPQPNEGTMQSDS